MFGDKQQTVQKDPGNYTDVPFEEYIKIDAINHSMLTKFMNESPFHFKYKMENGLYGDTDALAEGRVIHEAVLEPDKFDEKYEEEPNDWRDYKPFLNKKEKNYCERKEVEAGKEGEGGMSFIAKNSNAWNAINQIFLNKLDEKGMEPISTELLWKCRQINNNLGHNEKVQQIFEDSTFEVTMVWIDEETGLKCKGRLDVNSNKKGYACDLKKVRSANPNWFASDVRKYHYNSQAAFYMDGATTLGMEEFKAFIWLACEAEDPFYILPIYTRADGSKFGASEWITSGRTWYRNAIEKLNYCRETGDWHGYHDTANDRFDMFELPEMMY